MQEKSMLRLTAKALSRQNPVILRVPDTKVYGLAAATK